MEEKRVELLRDDENIRKAGELIVGQFKYLAGLCSVPIIVILAFFRGDASEFGGFGKVLVSVPVCALMVSGSIFFLAYQKQTLMIAHALMGKDALQRAFETNPSVFAEVEINAHVAQRLGDMANDVAFPLMTVSYVLLALAAVLTIWL
jgi:hypothetical protein